MRLAISLCGLVHAFVVVAVMLLVSGAASFKNENLFETVFPKGKCLGSTIIAKVNGKACFIVFHSVPHKMDLGISLFFREEFSFSQKST